jgi:hypothetical protein
VAQMMGNHHSTTRSVHDLLDGTEATFSSEVAPSVGEKRKGAIPAVKSGNFNQKLLLSSAYSPLI